MSWGLPALLASVYVIALLANFGSVITSINMNADAVVAPVMAKLLGQAPVGSHVVLGNHPYYEEFLFLRATAGLPFYRQVWDVAPMLWTFTGFALLGWCAWRAVGGHAALLATAALVCLGKLGRFSFFTFNWHGLTAIYTIIIAAALVWLAPRAYDITWRRLIGLGVALGVVSALPLASDKLFLVWALLPMSVTATVMAWRSTGRARWTPLVLTLVTVLASVGLGAEFAGIMRAGGITANPFPFTFVRQGQVVSHLGLLLGNYTILGGGYFFGRPLNVVGYAVLVNGALILIALFLGLVEVRSLASVGRAPQARRRVATPMLAYVAFWASSLVIQSAAFVGTSVAETSPDTLSSRYVLAGYLAIIALMPLLARRSRAWRAAVVAGVCVFALSSTYQLVRQPFDPVAPPGLPSTSVSDRLLSFASAQGVRIGYAGYWDAEELTWMTDFNLKIYPLQSGCGRFGLCPYRTSGIDTWYRARAGTRTLLIADIALPAVFRADVRSIDPRLGSPMASAHIGNLVVAVYPFDIASKLSQ